MRLVADFTSFSSSSLIELKEDTVIVVLGASGDLAKKKTVSIIAHRPVCEKIPH